MVSTRSCINFLFFAQVPALDLGSCSPHCHSKDTLGSCRLSLFLGKELRQHDTHKKKLICVGVPKLCGLNLIDANALSATIIYNMYEAHSSCWRWFLTLYYESRLSSSGYITESRSRESFTKAIPNPVPWSRNYY